MIVLSHTAALILMKNKINPTLDSDAQCIRAVGLVGDIQYSLRLQTVSSSTPGILNQFTICYLLTEDLADE